MELGNRLRSSTRFHHPSSAMTAATGSSDAVAVSPRGIINGVSSGAALRRTRRGKSARMTPLSSRDSTTGVVCVESAEEQEDTHSSAASLAASLRLSGRLLSRDLKQKDDDDDDDVSDAHSNSFLAFFASRDSITTRNSTTTTTTTTSIPHSRLTPDITPESVSSSYSSSLSTSRPLFLRRRHHRSSAPSVRRRSSSSSLSSSSHLLRLFALGLVSVFCFALLLPSANAFPSCSPNPCNHGAECVDSDTEVSWAERGA